MQREQKREFVKQFNSILKDKEFMLVVDYKGLNVSQISSLREKISSANSNFRVAKNTLARMAIKNTNFQILDKLFVGPTSIAYSDDPVSTSKVLVDFAKDNENLKILGGAMGDKELTVDEIKQLASLPSMDSLRAKIIGLISAPQRNIVLALQGTQSNILRLINANFKN